MPCGCGGSGDTSADGTRLSGELDSRYGVEGVAKAANDLIYSQGFWVLAVLIIGGAWAFRFIAGAPKEGK